MLQFTVYKLNPKESYLILIFFSSIASKQVSVELMWLQSICIYCLSQQIAFITMHRARKIHFALVLYVYSSWDRKSFTLPCRTFNPFYHSDSTGFKDIQHLMGQGLRAFQGKPHLNQLYSPSRAPLLGWFYLLFLELIITHSDILISKNWQRKLTSIRNILLKIRRGKWLLPLIF